jgi:hypothetical protein
MWLFAVEMKLAALQNVGRRPVAELILGNQWARANTKCKRVVGSPRSFWSCGLRPAPLQVGSGRVPLAYCCHSLSGTVDSKGLFRVKGPPRLTLRAEIV